MGLQPSWLDNCGEGLIKLYEEVEDAILADMARRISAYDYYIPAADYQRQVLAEMGATQQYIVNELAKRTGRTQRELKKLMQEAGMQALRSDAEIYRRNGKSVPAQASEYIQNLLAAGYRQTLGSFRNLTRTTAQVGSSQFIRQLDTAWLAVSSGSMSSDQAVRSATRRLSASGTRCCSLIKHSKRKADQFSDQLFLCYFLFYGLLFLCF